MKKLFTSILLLSSIEFFGQTTFRFTEYYPIKIQSFPSIATQADLPWFEMEFNGEIPVNLGQYALRVQSGESNYLVHLPDTLLQPGEILVCYLDASLETLTEPRRELTIPVNVITGLERFYLIGQDGAVVDSLGFDTPILPNEVWIKEQISGEWNVFPESFASQGAPNDVYTNWKKLASQTNLPPADSEPNACLAYDGKLWVFGGWGNHEGNGHLYTTSYVWNSDDGIHWQKLSDSTPFTHYSAFGVFNDSIWVYGNYKIYTSNDGINWNERGDVPYIYFGTSARLAVKDNKIYFFDSSRSGVSSDGVNFTISNHGISPRLYGAFNVMRDSLYYIGGLEMNSSKLLDEVWASANGLNWQKLTDSTGWAPRKWFMSQVLDDKLWVMGGYAEPDYDANIASNQRDIWYSSDGVHWHEYAAANPFGYRHAAYNAVKDNKIFVMNGFDNFERHGFFGDTWTFEIENYFLKPGMDYNGTQSWSATRNFKGPAPKDFPLKPTFYHFTGTEPLTMANHPAFDRPGNTLLIGDGIAGSSVQLEPGVVTKSNVVVTAQSTLTINRQYPLFPLYAHHQSTVFFNSCKQINLPKTNYGNLRFHNVTLLKSDSIRINGNFKFNSVSILGKNSKNLWVHVKGSITLGNLPSDHVLIVTGTAEANQDILTHGGGEKSINKLVLIKGKGDFVLKDPLKITESLKVLTIRE